MGREDAAALREGMEALRKALAAGEAEVLRRSLDELSSLSYQVTERVYASLGGESDEA